MTDRSSQARSSSHISSSRAAAADPPSASSSVRPRNRRLVSTEEEHDEPSSNRSSALLSAFSHPTSRAASRTASRTASPQPGAPRSVGVSPSGSTGDLGQFLADSWTQSWSSVQEITTTFLSNVGQGKTVLDSRAGPRQSPRGRRLSPGEGRKPAASWGPAPPAKNPGLDDVAAGSLAKRQAALKAAKTASVLESHDGVNGGLDVSGRHKRRNSDEVASTERSRDDDYLVYIHKVQPYDTYAGVILRYRCREDAFRRANGLWSRDSIQTRRWLTVPVAACDIRGRPCDPPSWHNSQGVDLLARTPSLGDDPKQTQETQQHHDDFFSKPIGQENAVPQEEAEDKPWTHVRWVKIDSIQDPVEIGRVARGTMGYFPPRRRKSMRTISSISTPRQSFDLPSTGPGSFEDSQAPRRPSSLSSSRPQFAGTPTSSRSRMGSDGADSRPAWMKRPGGVGTMGRNARAPGPDKDVINTWTRKHMPGLNIDSLPSMSIMGSETARFGFAHDTDLAQSSYEDGRDVTAPSRQGTGFDRAASTVEAWVRGALARRPGTPMNRVASDRVGAPGTPGEEAGGDLIELTDTASDDGRGLGDRTPDLIGNLSLGSTGWSEAGSSAVRGRTMTGGSKGGKAD